MVSTAFVCANFLYSNSVKTLKLEHKSIQPYICIFITSSSKVVRLHIFSKIKVRIVNNPEIPSCRALLISYYGDYSFLTGPSKNLKTGALALVMAQLDDSFWSHRRGVMYISVSTRGDEVHGHG